MDYGNGNGSRFHSIFYLADGVGITIIQFYSNFEFIGDSLPSKAKKYIFKL